MRKTKEGKIEWSKWKKKSYEKSFKYIKERKAWVVGIEKLRSRWNGVWKKLWVWSEKRKWNRTRANHGRLSHFCPKCTYPSLSQCYKPLASPCYPKIRPREGFGWLKMRESLWARTCMSFLFCEHECCLNSSKLKEIMCALWEWGIFFVVKALGIVLRMSLQLRKQLWAYPCLDTF